MPIFINRFRSRDGNGFVVRHLAPGWIRTPFIFFIVYSRCIQSIVKRQICCHGYCRLVQTGAAISILSQMANTSQARVAISAKNGNQACSKSFVSEGARQVSRHHDEEDVDVVALCDDRGVPHRKGAIQACHGDRRRLWIGHSSAACDDAQTGAGRTAVSMYKRLAAIRCQPELETNQYDW